MANQKTLSKFEWIIMDIIWDNPKSNVRDVLENLPEEHQKAYTTVQTYLERLVKKGFLAKEKIGMVNFYNPKVDRKTVQADETENFIKKTFQGSATKLAAFLFDSNKLNENDLTKIKKMIDEEEQNE